MELDPEKLRSATQWLLQDATGRLVGLACVLLYVLGWWRIFARAGFPGALAWLMLVPPIALGLWLFLAFAPWPARRELRALRRVQRVVHQAERRNLSA